MRPDLRFVQFSKKTLIDIQTRLFDEERFFSSADGTKVVIPPTFSPESSLQLSFVVPAYNEEKRLDPMMEQTMKYCVKRASVDRSFTYEVIIVSDGR